MPGIIPGKILSTLLEWRAVSAERARVVPAELSMLTAPAPCGSLCLVYGNFAPRERFLFPAF